MNSSDTKQTWVRGFFKQLLIFIVGLAICMPIPYYYISRDIQRMEEETQRKIEQERQWELRELRWAEEEAKAKAERAAVEKWRQENPEEWAEQQRIEEEAKLEKYRQEYIEEGDDAVWRHKEFYERVWDAMQDASVGKYNRPGKSYRATLWKNMFGYEAPDWALKIN